MPDQEFGWLASATNILFGLVLFLCISMGPFEQQAFEILQEAKIHRFAGSHRHLTDVESTYSYSMVGVECEERFDDLHCIINNSALVR